MKPRNATAWQETSLPQFPTLTGDRDFDAVVVGGGITGLTAAYLLKRAGKSVCLLERGRLASGDTGLTTAHLTHVTDERLPALVRGFGEEGARMAWQGGAAAINTIEAIAREHRIACDFKRVPGYLHAPLSDSASNEKTDLQNEAELAAKLGFDAEFVTAPYVKRPGIRFNQQAKFHPLKYLAGLAPHVNGQGSAIFEQSEVTQVHSDPLAVEVNGHRIRCGFLVIATHVPLMGQSTLAGATLFQTKLAPYTSYALSGSIERGAVPEASFWDTSDPYYYLRVDAGESEDYLIFGGEDHKTGQESDTEAPFARLEKAFREVVPAVSIDRRWSGQVIETHDGLPYIGRTNDQQFIATGFAGNGMTFGTLAAMMACDAALGRDNPWFDLFDPSRKKLRGAWDYLTENFDYPYYLLADRLRGVEADSAIEVARGEGKIITHQGQRVACSRDEQGEVTMVSAVCTHMGCLVRWNQAEATWDCPCHGSRFKPDGAVLAGPAETPLEPIREHAATS